MEYLLITDWHLVSLNMSVNDKLKEGWVLYGSPSIGKVDSGSKYLQAVVRSEKGDVKWINLERGTK